MMWMDSGSCLVRDSLRDHAGASNLALNEKVRTLIANGRDLTHFGFGQSPFPPMELAKKALQDSADRTSYESVQGIPSVRQAICGYHQSMYRCQFLPEQVIIGPGSKELIYLLMSVFDGDIILPSPAWVTYKPQAVLAHHKPVIIDVPCDGTGWRLTPECLEKMIVEKCHKPHRLLVLCNPCNPTGTVYVKEQLQSLVPVFRKHRVIVLADEIYGQLTFTGPGTHVSLAELYPEGTIVSNGLSKWASAGGWRFGYHIYPKELKSLLSAVSAGASHTFTSVCTPVQHAAEQIFLHTDESRQYAAHCTRILSAVGHYVYRELSSVGVKATPPQGGFYIFPDFDVVRQRLERENVYTGEQLFSRIMDEAAVVLLAAGPSLLRSPTEWTARLSFTDFDGSQALSSSKEIGLGSPLPTDFTEQHCGKLCRGIQRLKDWTLKYSST